MKKRTYITIALITIMAILVWLSRKPALPISIREQASTMQTNVLTSTSTEAQLPATTKLTSEFESVKAQIERDKQNRIQTAMLWRTPLLYYGKVVDENNQPIAGVQVSYGGNALNATLTEETRNEGSVTTDERGIFKIDELRGIGLMFDLSHPNYYPYPDNSTGFDVRSRPRDGIIENSEATARLFRMHSKGKPVPLVHRADGINVPLDGIAKVLDLRGSDYNQKIGQLVVEATGTPPPRYSREPFDWGAKITVPGGGLMEYTNQFDFVAPAMGYQPSVEFSFPKETAGWTETVSKNYFVKLPLGYARLNIYIGAKQPLFFSIEYDYNPDGSANLERAR